MGLQLLHAGWMTFGKRVVRVTTGTMAVAGGTCTIVILVALDWASCLAAQCVLHPPL